jgi:hypothetical protein
VAVEAKRTESRDDRGAPRSARPGQRPFKPRTSSGAPQGRPARAANGPGREDYGNRAGRDGQKRFYGDKPRTAGGGDRPAKVNTGRRSWTDRMSKSLD